MSLGFDQPEKLETTELAFNIKSNGKYIHTFVRVNKHIYNLIRDICFELQNMLKSDDANFKIKVVGGLPNFLYHNQIIDYDDMDLLQRYTFFNLPSDANISELPIECKIKPVPTRKLYVITRHGLHQHFYVVTKSDVYSELMLIYQHGCLYIDFDLSNEHDLKCFDFLLHANLKQLMTYTMFKPILYNEETKYLNLEYISYLINRTRPTCSKMYSILKFNENGDDEKCGICDTEHSDKCAKKPEFRFCLSPACCDYKQKVCLHCICKLIENSGVIEISCPFCSQTILYYELRDMKDIVFSDVRPFTKQHVELQQLSFFDKYRIETDNSNKLKYTNLNDVSQLMLLMEKTYVKDTHDEEVHDEALDEINFEEELDEINFEEDIDNL